VFSELSGAAIGLLSPGIQSITSRGQGEGKQAHSTVERNTSRAQTNKSKSHRNTAYRADKASTAQSLNRNSQDHILLFRAVIMQERLRTLTAGRYTPLL
jgi:hypothetical protein